MVIRLDGDRLPISVDGQVKLLRIRQGIPELVVCLKEVGIERRWPVDRRRWLRPADPGSTGRCPGLTKPRVSRSEGQWIAESTRWRHPRGPIDKRARLPDAAHRHAPAAAQDLSVISFRLCELPGLVMPNRPDQRLLNAHRLHWDGILSFLGPMRDQLASARTCSGASVIDSVASVVQPRVRRHAPGEA